MQIDERMLKRLLAMNDEQLGQMIQKIAAETGIDPAQLGINPQSIESVRSALGSKLHELRVGNFVIVYVAQR